MTIYRAIRALPAAPRRPRHHRDCHGVGVQHAGAAPDPLRRLPRGAALDGPVGAADGLRVRPMIILAATHPSAGNIVANIGQVISYLMSRKSGQPPPPSGATAEFAIAAVIIAAGLWHLVKRSLAS
jgi:hypothetical protein